MARPLFLFLGIIVSAQLFAQLPALKGFNQEIFQYHFERADRAEDSSSWLEQARLGRELALRAWERAALELYDEASAHGQALSEIGRWSEQELERRFTEWLLRRFFAGQFGEMIADLGKNIDRANKLYAYHTGDDGNIAYNGETGDPQAYRPFEGRDPESDRASWRDFVSGETESGEYQNILLLHPEILAYIPEDQRGAFQNRFDGLYGQALLKKEAELAALIAREERLFTARRTGDIWSLRKKSEDVSASAIGAQLVLEADAVCALGIASLEARIESAQAGTGDLALMGEDWLNAFQEQFNRGLQAWERAEENFLVRRMEWERDSGEYFLSGQEAWQNAFSRLEQERLVWEDRARELFEAGEKLFSDVSQQLRLSISEAKSEFEKEAALRVSSGTERAAAWVNMYVTCSSVLAEAKTSVQFWLSRFVNGAPKNGLEQGTLASWVEQRIKTSKLSAVQMTAGQELLRWSAIYTQYRNKARESLNILERELGMVLAMDKNALNSVQGLQSEDFFLDEYQIEILRVQAVSAYWNQRLAIAQAVSDYAVDLSAGRMTEAESLAKWTNAKAAYDAALSSYTETQERLKAAGLELDTIRNELQNAASLLTAAEKKLDELNNNYARQMTVYRLNSGAFILNELGSYYASLIEAMESRRHDTAYYTAYLRAELNYTRENDLQDAWALLESITSGDNSRDETKRMQLALLSAESAAEWYFEFRGIEASSEARQSLKNEGLVKRLEREAAEETVPGRAALLLSVYRDAAIYSPAAALEAAESSWKTLCEVFSEFGAPVAGNSLPEAQAITGALFLYADQYDLSPGAAAAALMARIDEKTETLPAMLAFELNAWKESVVDYMAAKTLYRGVSVPEESSVVSAAYEYRLNLFLARINNGEDAGDMSGELSFYYYLSCFLALYEEKSLVIETAKQEGMEHWRTYISSPYFDPYNIDNRNPLPAAVAGDPEFARQAVSGALSWEEGMLADARELEMMAREKMTAAFSLFLNSPFSDGQKQFIVRAGVYLSDPGAPREIPQGNSEYDSALEIFREESEKLQYKTAYEQAIRDQTALLGFEYNNLPPSGQAALNELNAISARLEETRKAHQKLLEQYNLKAAAFASTGSRYEERYGETKQSFDDLEKKRLEYEKQDAVRRWAATAYLGQGAEQPAGLQYYKEPAGELIYARERSERAKIALAALQNIYNRGETNRAYEGTEYGAVYRQYEESFSRMFLTLKAKTEFESVLYEEQLKNSALYISVSEKTNVFLNPAMQSYYDNYAPPLLQESSWMDFIRITESGGLGISFDKSTFALTQINSVEAALLSEYFKNSAFTGDGTSQMSDFEKSLAGWAARMKSYNLENMGAYQTWGLALDYVLKNITGKNPSVTQIQSSYTLTDMGSDGGMKLGSSSLNSLLAKYRNGRLSSLQQNAWNSLGARQKEDLEFLAALYLTGGIKEGASGLSRVSEYREMAWLYEEADYYVIPVRIFGRRVGTVYRWPYTFDSSALKQVLSASKNRRNAFSNAVNNGRASLKKEVTGTISKVDLYKISCEKLAVLTKHQEQGISWDDVEPVLRLVEKINDSEIKTMSVYWNEMNSRQDQEVFTNINAALDGIYSWSRGIRDILEIQVEKTYLADETVRRINQEEYRKTLDEYINGKCTPAELHEIALLCYGAEAPALKNHLKNLGHAMISDLKSIDAENAVYTRHYRELAEQYTELTGRAYEARYNAELTARETEWNEQQKDIDNKLEAWREASFLILERGRRDWKDGLESMRASLLRWERNFEERYTAVDAAWSAAYLESLKDKESWINRAVGAANTALDGAFLASVGSDAESYSRKLSAFMPSSVPGFDGNEAAEALRKVLYSAGINNLYGAFNAISGSAGTVLTKTRSGASGLGVWNAAQAHAAAKELAWNSTQEMADGKMTLLAFQAREAAYAAKKALEETIAQNNKGFNSSMDETFTMEGGWNRFGNQYVKDIIVHSTFFRSAITDRVVVQSYRFYVMDAWDFVTDLSDDSMKGLDHSAIQALVAMAQKEVQEQSKIIFGDGDNPGRYGTWIGIYNGSKNSGELGRLLSDYYKWSAKQSQGVALMNAPLWDKPLWDSRGSWFSAPSLRSAAEMAMTLVSAVATAASPLTGGASLLLGAGINLLDDVLFNGLDVAYGYKNWGEAGFAFGKKTLTSIAASGAGAVFNGVGNTAGTVGGGLFNDGGLSGYVTKGFEGTFGGTVAKTFVSGVQTAATSTVTSALSAITYTNGTFGWSQDAYNTGIKGGLSAALTGATSALTGGILDALNTGRDSIKLSGFSPENIQNTASLNRSLGGLAGQGVNYAMTGDISLNILNADIFKNRDGNGVSMGLLELHLGDKGFNMNLGSGGLDASYAALSKAFSGAAVWGTNTIINAFTKKKDLNIAVALRAQYGFGEKAHKNQLWDILKGKTRMSAANEEYGALSKTEQGVKTIYLGNYVNEMSNHDQMRLAVVLGHEAFRDGYGTGMTDNNGNPVTGDSNFQELKNASIARIMMSDRINQDYDWFYRENQDLGFESFFMYAAGTGELFDLYLENNYKNDQDYYWQWVSSGESRQNGKEEYKDIALINSFSRKEVDEHNKMALSEALDKYKAIYSAINTNAGGRNYFLKEADNVILAQIKKDEGLQKTLGVELLNYYSLYDYGCVLFSAMYGVESVTGEKLDPEQVNQFAKENGFFDKGENGRGGGLSKQLMAKLMTALSEGKYKFELVFTDANPSLKDLLEYENDETTMYISHIRIPGSNGHSEMIAGIEYDYTETTNPVDGSVVSVPAGIKSITTANPLEKKNNALVYQTKISMEHIVRWDIFRVTRMD